MTHLARDPRGTLSWVLTTSRGCVILIFACLLHWHCPAPVPSPENRVAKPGQKEALLQSPQGGFASDFLAIFSPLNIQNYPMTAVPRGAGTTETASKIVCAVKRRLRARFSDVPPQYEANPATASHVSVPRRAASM